MSSPSLYVVGFKPPDEKWKQMKAIWEACQAAKVGLPAVVEKFFNGECPDDKGVEVALVDSDNMTKPKIGICTKYVGEMCEGYDIEVAKLPKDVKIIRVYNSY